MRTPTPRERAIWTHDQLTPARRPMRKVAREAREPSAFCEVSGPQKKCKKRLSNMLKALASLMTTPYRSSPRITKCCWPDC
jgi:hypothetical protein